MDKKTCLNTQNHDIRTNSPCGNVFTLNKFLFWKLMNKNVFEWFLVKICKEHTLTRSTTIFSRNHPTLCFWLKRESRQMSNTEQLLHQTDNSHQRCSIKKAVLKNFAIFTVKQLRWSLFLITLPAFRPATLLERDSNTGAFLLGNFLKNLFRTMLLNWL